MRKRKRKQKKEKKRILHWSTIFLGTHVYRKSLFEISPWRVHSLIDPPRENEFLPVCRFSSLPPHRVFWMSHDDSNLEKRKGGTPRALRHFLRLSSSSSCRSPPRPYTFPSITRTLRRYTDNGDVAGRVLMVTFEAGQRAAVGQVDKR